MKDLAHSLATRKGKEVAKDPIANSFDDLWKSHQREVLTKFARDHNWSRRAMKHIPAKHFGWVAQQLIRADISESEIRAFAPEVGRDPDAPLDEIESPVACEIESSRERSMIAAAEQRDDVRYKEDADSQTPYHERFVAVDEDEGPNFAPPNCGGSSYHPNSETTMPPSSQKARDHGEWTDPHRPSR